MKLLKIILFFFAIYFIRRFFQLYKAMKNIQENRPTQNKTQPQENIINADFRVVD